MYNLYLLSGATHSRVLCPLDRPVGPSRSRDRLGVGTAARSPAARFAADDQTPGALAYTGTKNAEAAPSRRRYPPFTGGGGHALGCSLRVGSTNQFANDDAAVEEGRHREARRAVRGHSIRGRGDDPREHCEGQHGRPRDALEWEPGAAQAQEGHGGRLVCGPCSISSRTRAYALRDRRCQEPHLGLRESSRQDPGPCTYVAFVAAVGPDAAPARDDGPCVAGGVGRRQHRRPRTFCARRNAYLRVSPVSPRSPAHRTHGGRARWPSPRRSGLALVSVRYTTSPVPRPPSLLSTRRRAAIPHASDTHSLVVSS